MTLSAAQQAQVDALTAQLEAENAPPPPPPPPAPDAVPEAGTEALDTPVESLLERLRLQPTASQLAVVTDWLTENNLHLA
jgi:hypothetical protein